MSAHDCTCVSVSVYVLFVCCLCVVLFVCCTRLCLLCDLRLCGVCLSLSLCASGFPCMCMYLCLLSVLVGQQDCMFLHKNCSSVSSCEVGYCNISNGACYLKNVSCDDQNPCTTGINTHKHTQTHTHAHVLIHNIQIHEHTCM